jgi:hypothetical protein
LNWSNLFFFNEEHFYIAHVFRFPTYFVHFPCFVDAEKRVKKKETSDLTESWIIRYSWFCCPCMRCEMSIIRKMGLWISDVIFFFFFMLHLWAVCQKMPVRPSHSAEDKLNLSKNCNKKTKQWMLQHEDFRTIRQSSKSSIHFIILKVVRFGIYRYIILKGFLYFCKDLHCFEKLWFIHPYYLKKTQTSICLCLASFAESRTTFFCTLLCIFFIKKTYAK